jgi:HD-like signal output (HDOD) protein
LPGYAPKDFLKRQKTGKLPGANLYMPHPDYPTIDHLLAQVGNLPTMPQVVHKALQIIENPKSNMGDLAKVIKLDQAMSSLILRWVNSGYYSLRSQLISIEQAIPYLGQRTVQNLVLTASISSFMTRPVPGYELASGDLWKRAVGMAAGARLVMMDIAPALAEDAYYAGLFSDVGKLAFNILLQKITVDWEKLNKYAFDEIETSLFGYNHAEVGAEIVRRWNLSESLVHIIRNHHTPAKVENEQWKTITYAVHAADAILMMFGIGSGLDSMQYKLDPETITRFKWDENTFSRIYDRLTPLIEEANKFIQQ